MSQHQLITPCLSQDQQIETGVAHRVRVSDNALYKRINRVLKYRDELLRTTRGKWKRRELGDYYILDIQRGWINKFVHDLRELGRDLGVLQPHEE